MIKRYCDWCGELQEEKFIEVSIDTALIECPKIYIPRAETLMRELDLCEKCSERLVAWVDEQVPF